MEICCRCGFVHKYSNYSDSYRSYKPHYYWTPSDKLTRKAPLHAIICVACCSQLSASVDWKEFAEQQQLTHEKGLEGLRAPLPDRLLSYASQLYSMQAKYFF